jgi:glutamate N-acetyltransferase/amino-acid N-acetyltransferase
MSVTAAKGFRAAGVTAGLKSSGAPDVALVVNDGPRFAAAGVFTRNRVKAAPVLWSQQVLSSQVVRAVVLNSGGANACTGSDGFLDTHRTAEHVGGLLDVGAAEVAVCSTGLIGIRLPMSRLLPGITAAADALSIDGGAQSAVAIMTTDTVPKTATASGDGFVVGGMAKGAGMLAPSLATMLVVVTTDAVVAPADLDAALRASTRVTFDRVDSDGCTSTNDTVLLLASGASGVTPSLDDLTAAVTSVCADLARQIVADAEGASKDVRIDVVNAATEEDAVEVGRTVARANLVKCAIHGEDPNWGRILAEVGMTSAAFEVDDISVALNGVWVCRDGASGDAGQLR